MKITICKAAICAALAAGMIGGAVLSVPHAPTAEAQVMRAEESGYCVIYGRTPSTGNTDTEGGGASYRQIKRTAKKAEVFEIEPEKEPASQVKTADLHVEIVPIEGMLPEVESVRVPIYSEDELEMLACAIYQEAGGNACSDLCRMYVGDVMLNRVNDPRFPNALYEVLTQEHQYGLFGKTGIIWPGRASDPNEAAAVERAYDTARALLEGEHSELYGAGYIYQDTQPRGKDVIYLDGEYFGR